MTANHLISFAVTEKQFHIIKELARSEYRTIDNLTAMLIAIGYQWYSEDHSIYVKKHLKDIDPEKGDYQVYEDAEVEKEIKRIPFNALPSHLQ